MLIFLQILNIQLNVIHMLLLWYLNEDGMDEKDQDLEVEDEDLNQDG
ncbi:hypothetical protein GLYMA_06G243050v4 [Glycine max]|nr:hypothetical protein GLYMA_06G243050v4 [Glycine max]KAH1127420.1 hypothetical protein GYH30_016132 [Glycine max]